MDYKPDEEMLKKIAETLEANVPEDKLPKLKKFVQLRKLFTILRKEAGDFNRPEELRLYI